MVKLAYLLLTKVFEVYKDVYPSKIKFKFDTSFLIDTVFFVTVHKCTKTFCSFKKVSNLNFFFTMI